MPDRRTLLLTRPLAQSRDFAAAVETDLPGRFRCLIAPVMRIAPTEGPIDLSGAQGLLFTSANGVEQFAARTPDRRLPALCVGAMTAEAARRIGLAAEAAEGDVAALARLAIAAYRPGAGDFVHVRGRHAAGDLLGLLRAAGVPGRAAELYDQLPCPLTADARDLLAAGRIDVIALFSPRSAALLAAQIRAGGWTLGHVTSVALSAAADAGFDAQEPGARRVAAQPTRAGMIAALARVRSQLSRPGVACSGQGLGLVSLAMGQRAPARGRRASGDRNLWYEKRPARRTARMRRRRPRRPDPNHPMPALTPSETPATEPAVPAVEMFETPRMPADIERGHGSGSVRLPEPPVEDAEDQAILDAVDDAIESGEPAPPEPENRIDEPTPFAPGRARETPAETHPETHEEHHAEEGTSFASRVLTALLLLIVGAGLALWGAPKLAPMLPSGMAPVAGWLTPGLSQAETHIAALESRLDTDLGSVRTQVADLSGPALDSRIGTALSATEAKVEGDLDGLRQQIGELDGADTRQRLARLESSIEGQTAELATLKQQISGGAAAASGEATAQIDVYRAELDGLRAEMGTLSDTVATLSARIDEVSAEANRQIETAQTKVAEVQTEASTAVGAATLKSDLATVEAAMAAGQPFAEPLERLAGDPGVTIPPALTAAAETGIVSLATLRDGFPDAAHEAIRASILAGAGDGILARSRAFVSAQIATRSLTPQEGQGPDAVLSRMEDKLRQDDVAGALAEADQLPSEAAAAMSGWLEAARLRAGAEAGLSTLTADLSATN